MDNNINDYNSINNVDDTNRKNNEQKVKSSGCFYRGVATGVSVTLAVLIMALVINILVNKEYIETDDKDQMLQNAFGSMTSGDVEISEEMMEIFSKAQYIQEIIDTYYYYDEDMQDLADGIYAGMLQSLGDPYSVYYDEESFNALMESTTGTYCGIGVVVQQDPETMIITVVNPYEGCPGYEAGLQPGDIILGADELDFTNMDINEAVSYIKGEEDTSVVLHIMRGEEKKDITVTRRMIDIPTVSYELVEGNIAHIVIASFDEVTYDQFEEAMEQAEADGCKGYIFDVRDNGGGLYDTVVDMLDDLLPKGKIVYTEDKSGHQETEYSNSDCLEAPMAVLINGNSASASEIFAGAIQDYGVGKIIGTKSFGKGIVQSIMSLGDGTAVKVTISSYFTPNGRNIHGEGISPDMEIQLPQDENAYENGYLKPECDTQLQEAIKYIQSELN
ncbi:MAG: S41 family peptidase [Lachnospiraceae bacterium]|nr:S41 family peptidase [Lachnospiraceae bacterium]